MVLSGKTPILVNGKATRVLSSLFNRAVKRSASVVVQDESGCRIVPSKGLSWNAVAVSIRAGKKVQARVETR